MHPAVLSHRRGKSQSGRSGSLVSDICGKDKALRLKIPALYYRAFRLF